MTQEWIACVERMPADGQKVWYFGDMIGVWQGRYEYHNRDTYNPHLFICEEGLGVVDREDAPYWMPHSEGDERPARPFKAQEQA